MSDQNKEKHFEITVEPNARKNRLYTLREKDLKNNTITKFIPLYGDYLSIFERVPKLRFKIVNSTSRFSVGSEKNSTNTLIGKALLRGEAWESISFFGSDKEIKNFEIKIKSVKSLNPQGFAFYAYKPENTNSDEEETIYITIYLHSLKYKKIKNSLEKGFIKEIHCNINLANEDNASNVRGLYIADFCRMTRFHKFKVLHSVDDIENKLDLPENFDNYGAYGLGLYQHHFSISIIENLFFTKSGKDDDLYSENKNNSLPKTEQTLLSITKQSKNIITKLLWLLIIITAILIFKF
ncbi:MAG: hypothetical protein FJX70_06905 [Alphaproteobacteria bacterium]|nr:hypothetical protein [Alphaproteobacteria bacterium]